MVKYALAIGLPEWANAVFFNVWTYVVLVAVFGVILIIAVILLFKTFSEQKNGKSANDSANPDTIQESELAAKILSIRNNPRSILLAAAGIQCMPVTVPIRMAVNLASKGKKCLLIDLDVRRDAIARVFHINPQTPPSFEPVATDIENIHVIAAHVFASTNTMHVQALTRSAAKKFDVALISAPYLDGHPDRRQIVASAEYAVLFAETGTQLKRLQDLCKSARCKVFGSYRTNEPVSAGEEVLSQ